MARLSRYQKVQRALRFIMGLGDPRVAAQLLPYGLDDQVKERAKKLLCAAVLPPGGVKVVAPEPNPVQEVERFARKWFRIVKITLSNHHPELSRPLEETLSVTRGAQAAAALLTLLARLRAFENGEFGEEGLRAMTLLSERGLTPEVLAEAERATDVAGEFEQDDLDVWDEAEDRAQELWAFYLEWSAIARSLLSDRKSLRALGFRPRGSGQGSEASEKDAA